MILDLLLLRVIHAPSYCSFTSHLTTCFTKMSEIILNKSAYFTHPDFSAAKLEKSAQITPVNTVYRLSNNCYVTLVKFRSSTKSIQRISVNTPAQRELVFVRLSIAALWSLYHPLACIVSGNAFYQHISLHAGTRWRIWLMRCSTSWKVASSIFDGVIGIYRWHNVPDALRPWGRLSL
jgi:hypothetical protein